MSLIAQACDNCDRKLKIPQKFAGKRVKCPGCDQAILVRIDPAENGIARKSPPPATPSRNSIPRDSVPSKPSTSPAPLKPMAQPGRTWIDFIVLPAMLLLAASYALLIMGVLAALFWHIFFNYKNILAIGEGASFVVFMIYVGLIVFGVGLAFFLLKPLMATRQKEICRIIQPKQEPNLFYLLNQITKRFGIQNIDYCEFDNSYGMTGRFVRNNRDPSKQNFVLRIGLPFIVNQQQQALVALLTTEILEKEFENRSFAARMIRKIHAWFSDVAQVRDSWDHRLAIMRARKGIFALPFIALFQLCVFLTRRILVIFHFTSRLISNFSFRNYYFDSDELAATYAGRKDMIRGDRESFVSRSAYKQGLVDFVYSYRARPIDDVAGIVESRRKNMNEQEVTHLTEKANRRWTRPWDSRSSLRRHIRRLSQEAAEEEKREIEKYIGSAKKNPD